VSRRLKFDIPGRDFRIDLEAIEPGSVAASFWEESFAPDLTPPLNLTVDIGFGRGEFLIDAARKDPNGAIVGIERSYKRTLKMARRLAKFGMANVRIVEGFGERAIIELFAVNSISTAWINFPDPWPKARHARRRLVRPEFVAELTARLVPGGLLHLATDDPDYAVQFDEVLSAASGLANLFAPDAFRGESTGRMQTAYELQWLAQGRPFHYFTYRRVTPSDQLESPASIDGT